MLTPGCRTDTPRIAENKGKHKMLALGIGVSVIFWMSYRYEINTNICHLHFNNF